MNNVVMYHGSDRADAVLDAVIGSGKLKYGFHMSHDINVARNYGSKIVKIVLESDLNKAHVGLINKSSGNGNHNKSVGNGIEYVLKDDAAINELYLKLWDAELVS
jgi:hypothetical protein